MNVREEAWVEYQRKRFMRPDAHRWMRPDADRLVGPNAADLGPDAIAAAIEQRGLTAVDPRQLEEVRREYSRLRWMLADIKLDLLRRRYLARKYSPDQPRVPAGSPAGGQWTAEGSAGVGVSSEGEGGNSSEMDSFSAARRRGRSQKFCWAQYTVDILLCNSLSPVSRRAICHSQAMERYAACIAGRPIPPLSY